CVRRGATESPGGSSEWSDVQASAKFSGSMTTPRGLGKKQVTNGADRSAVCIWRRAPAARLVSRAGNVQLTGSCRLRGWLHGPDGPDLGPRPEGERGAAAGGVRGGAPPPAVVAGAAAGQLRRRAGRAAGGLPQVLAAPRPRPRGAQPARLDLPRRPERGPRLAAQRLAATVAAAGRAAAVGRPARRLARRAARPRRSARPAAASAAGTAPRGARGVPAAAEQRPDLRRDRGAAARAGRHRQDADAHGAPEAAPRAARAARRGLTSHLRVAR